LGRIPKNTSDWDRVIQIDNPGAFSPLVVGIAQALLWPLVRLFFRPRLEGVVKLPKNGHTLLVVNHSAGAGIAEITCIIVICLRQAVPVRHLAFFALPQ